MVAPVNIYPARQITGSAIPRMPINRLRFLYEMITLPCFPGGIQELLSALNFAPFNVQGYKFKGLKS
jgi:hypothetical protein